VARACAVAAKLLPARFRVSSGQTLRQGVPSGAISAPKRDIQPSKARGEPSREPGQFATQNGAAEQSGAPLRSSKRLSELTAKLGFPEAECRAVVLAVDEALTNIIRHAYLGDAERPIEASFRRIQVSRDGKSGDALEIILEDRGVTANPKKMCGRALEDVRPGGLGLHFIRECMDTVEFSRRRGRNLLRLVKMLHSQGPSKGS